MYRSDERRGTRDNNNVAVHNRLHNTISYPFFFFCHSRPIRSHFLRGPLNKSTHHPMIPATAVSPHSMNTLDRVAFCKSVREKRKQLQLNQHTNGE